MRTGRDPVLHLRQPQPPHRGVVGHRQLQDQPARRRQQRHRRRPPALLAVLDLRQPGQRQLARRHRHPGRPRPAGSTAGDTTLAYTYNYPGHAHAVASITTTNSATGSSSTAQYGYDGDGNMDSRNGTQVNWNYDGTLASAGSDSYVYDADGNELTETTSAGTTLFLPGEQITSNGSTTTGVRYYSFGGINIAETTGSSLYWTESNLQGTLTTAVSAFSEIRRVGLPHHHPLRTTVSASGSAAWPDDRTFLNDATSPDTGLVDIGARKFDPATGLFISVDPILDRAAPRR